MSEGEVHEMKRLLQSAVRPAGETELSRDLWPTMVSRMSRQEVKVPWWDWVLLAGASLALWLFPALVPALLYHL
jgi:hypothetical protein